MNFAGNLDCEGKLSWRLRVEGGNMAAAMVAATGACVGLLGVSEVSVSSSFRAAAPSSLLVGWLTPNNALQERESCVWILFLVFI